MKNTVLIATCLLAGISLKAQALALGPAEFVASRNLACVLAQESLGYLLEDEYAAMTSELLDGYNQEESDVIYAKALGYYDGLMFDLPTGDEDSISDRLQQFVQSQACTAYTGYEGVKFTL